ncbi:MAG TPA: hypothetical protein VKA61_01630 [Sphingomicrobium sp.]|nr:hypothetical protein [Sphingomicrobium sp.]
MRRRDFIAATIGLASCGSLAARAQLERMRRIGLLLPVEQRDPFLLARADEVVE